MLSKIINWLNPLKARVLYVIDGDTLQIAYSFMNLKTTRIRLARVNAPEIANLKYNKLENQKGSLEAKFWLENRLENTYITFVDDNQPLTYGRLVAWVFDNNFVDICQEMVSLGLVKVYRNLKDDKEQVALELLESQAKAKKLGLWK